MADEFAFCMPKELPPTEQVAAATEACKINPCNRPPVEKVVDLLPVVATAMVAGPSAATDILVPGLLAVLTTKYWGAGGVELTVGFMEQTSAELRNRILGHMNAWSEFCNARFRWTQTSPQVRITRSGDGYWSYLGTDILRIPRNQPTMSLRGFSLSTPESEYRRVVRHETGHTLGFPHEHMRRAIVARLDPAKTIAWGARSLGWSAATVRQQILTPLEESSLLGGEPSPGDVDSIMCYQLPASITVDGRPIPGGSDIDAEDRLYAAKIYPLSNQPPPKPPPPKPPPPKPEPPKPGGKKMYAYPQFADVMVAIPEAVAALRSGEIVSATSAQAAWVVAGYGLSMILPPAAAAPGPEYTATAAADDLERLAAAQSDADRQNAAAAIPWVSIVLLLLKLLAGSVG